MAVATTYPPSHTHTHIHAPSSSSSPPNTTNSSPSTYNMAATLPPVDFSFSSLRSAMSSFTAKFDAFIETGRRQVLAERNSYRGRLSSLREEQSSTLRSLAALQQTHKLHASLVAQQSDELADLHGTIGGIAARRDAVAAANERLRRKIEETRRQIGLRRERQTEYADRFERQKGRDGPECEFWEGVLGMRLESAAKQQKQDDGEGNSKGGVVVEREGWIRVCFWELPTTTSSSSSSADTNANTNANTNGAGTTTTTATNTATAEAHFELDCSAPEYRLGKSVPPLPTTQTDNILARLNAEGDIAAFLKRMRGVVCEVLQRLQQQQQQQQQ